MDRDVFFIVNPNAANGRLGRAWPSIAEQARATLGPIAFGQTTDTRSEADNLTCYLVAEPYSSADFRHGPSAPASESTTMSATTRSGTVRAARRATIPPMDSPAQTARSMPRRSSTASMSPSMSSSV